MASCDKYIWLYEKYVSLNPNHNLREQLLTSAAFVQPERNSHPAAATQVAFQAQERANHLKFVPHVAGTGESLCGAKAAVAAFIKQI